MLELVLRLGLSLAVVLGLFWAVARTSARRMGRTAGPMKVRGRQSLSRTASMAVVEVGGRVLVVGVGDGGVRLLTELDPEELDQPSLPVPVQASATNVADSSDVTLGGSVLSPQTWKQAWAAASARTPGRRATHDGHLETTHD